MSRLRFRPKREKFNGSEKDLCDMFRAFAVSHGWAVFPETSGWDMIAVKDGTSDGQVTVGIQAKLHLNMKVIEQVVESRSQVNYAAILVPHIESHKALRALGIVGISLLRGEMHCNSISAYEEFSEREGQAYYIPVDTPAWLPEICPDWQPAGVPSPKSIGKWTENALRMIAEGAVEGAYTTSLFKKHKMNPALWIRLGWAEKVRRDGRGWIYAMKSETDIRNERPDKRHPEYYEKLLERRRKKAPESPCACPPTKHRRPIADTVISAVKKMTARKWTTMYWAVDFHDTVFPGKYSSDQELELAPGAAEVLKWISDRPNMKLIAYTSSYAKDYDRSTDWMSRTYGIKFDFLNENPDCGNTDYADFRSKFYFNVLLDDKAGFDPDLDWIAIKEVLIEIGLWNQPPDNLRCSPGSSAANEA